MPAGRPLNIKAPEDFEELAETYFKECRETERPLTVTGLALAVGLASRKSLCEYESRSEFSNAVKTAKLRIECSYEERLHAGNVAGAIFALKNFGWRDKQELDHTLDVKDPVLQALIGAQHKPKEGA